MTWLSPFGENAVNAAPRKALRHYQARLVADVCRSDGHVLVEQPTGSGKTLQIVTLVAMQLGKRFTHAVIAAPQQQIEEGFTDLDYRLVGFPACQGAATPDIEVPDRFVWGARNSKQLNSTGRLIAYLVEWAETTAETSPGPLPSRQSAPLAQCSAAGRRDGHAS